ncbi:DNA methylase N-4/N-6 [uncultured Caudovirales phage]|uniref:DNA methylase N-4/N-6 n=1 Tax=uncultured Caudovirales phage TaxID=2100421 RepID=A0A6J5KUH1_9CAUD|nr:DNA methylase N-4/N-6 [uncultured Caudovirales phage]
MDIQNLLSTNIRIANVSPLDALAIWPANIEISIFRIPIRKRDGYSLDGVQKLAKKLKTNTVKNGVVFVICYAPNEDKARPFEVAKAFADEGFTHIDNIIIEKSWLPGKRSESNLVNSHEYVFHFCNGKVWKLDRLPIQEYLKLDESISCSGNLWKVETGSLEEAYPLDLAELLIRMTDVLPGSMIFDPYMGTSASLLASLKLGHTFYGFEANQSKMKRYKKITEDFSKKEE